MIGTMLWKKANNDPNIRITKLNKYFLIKTVNKTKIQ